MYFLQNVSSDQVEMIYLLTIIWTKKQQQKTIIWMYEFTYMVMCLKRIHSSLILVFIIVPHPVQI